MSRPLPRLSLQGWLLALLLPTLGALIVVYASHLYLRLHDIIIGGFEHKLTAVSTTTAAFVDPAEHERLIEPLPIGAMDFNAADQTLWALDLSRHAILRIRPADGAIEPTAIAVPPYVHGLAIGPAAGECYVFDDETGRFWHRSAAGTGFAPAFQIEPPVTGAAFGPSGVLVVAGRGLRRVDLPSGRATPLHDLPEMLRGLAFDAGHGRLWGLSARGDEILEFDPVTGALGRRTKLLFAPAADGGPTPPAILRSLGFDPLGSALLGSSTSLVRIDPQTGALTTTGYVPSFGQEAGPLYRRYAEPMHRIMTRTGLTYLYTQAVRDRNRIIYGLDGTDGSAHSPLLSADVLPDTEVSGVQRLLTDGTVYVSDVQPWQQWGLLKSTFAPIFDEEGRPVAMAGADIDVSTIQFQSRRALVIAFAFGAVLLVLIGLLTYRIAHRLTEPLAAIKMAASRAAAGDYAQGITVANPLELHELAERFTAVANTLGDQVGQLRDTVSANQAERIRSALSDRLARTPILVPIPAEAAIPAVPAFGADPASVQDPDGVVRANEQMLAWFAPPSADGLAVAARRATIAVVAEALLQSFPNEATDLAAALEPLFPAEVTAWSLYVAGRWHLARPQPGRALRFEPIP
jgi:hypothetical protein